MKTILYLGCFAGCLLVLPGAAATGAVGTDALLSSRFGPEALTSASAYLLGTNLIPPSEPVSLIAMGLMFLGLAGTARRRGAFRR